MRTRTLLAVAAVGLAAAAAAQTPAEQATAAAGRRPQQRVLKTWDDTVKLDGREVRRHVEVVFDYAEGVARELSYDGSGQLVHSRVMAGQPRPSAEEIADAAAVVRNDPMLGKIAERTGARLEGMFVLEQKPGQPCGPRTRCLQVLFMAKEGYGLLRRVVVDLTRGQDAIVYRSYSPDLETGK